MKALIDSDCLVYRIGYSAEDVDSNIAIFRLRSMIDDILDDTGCREYKCFLSSEDKSNFRYEVDPQYKCSRTLPKPRYYHVLRKHLQEKHPTETVFGMEADDALGINQTTDTVIASIDKDLDQIPGKHYNFVKKILYEISPLEGLQWFYKQILIGDTSDDIQGLYGIGPKKAAKAIDPIVDEIEMYRTVIDMYQLKHPVDYYEKVLKAGRLLKIKQHKDEGLWEPPKE